MDAPRSARPLPDKPGEPRALLDDGIFVQVNSAFLERLGYPSGSDLLASNLLDHAIGLDKEELSLLLKQGQRTAADSKSLPSLNVTLRTASGDPLQAELHACHNRYDGEEVVEIHLVSAVDRQLGKRLRNLPWSTYACLLLLLAISALPNAILPRLNINNAPATYLPEDSPSRIFNDQVREIFPSDEVVILLFEGVALYSDGFLQAYDSLAQEIGELEAVEEVVAVTSQDHIEGTEDGFLVTPLFDLETLDETRPRERLARALEDRFANGTMLAADGSALAMVIIPTALDSSLLNMQLEEAILERVKQQRLQGYLTAVSGEIATDVAQIRMILHDNMIFIPLVTGLGLLLTWVLFRRLLAVIITGAVTGAVVNSTMALYVLFDQPFNSISSILPPLLSALTMAVLIHIYNTLAGASQRGLQGRERVRSAMQEVSRPALYSTLTTAIGLASLGLSTIPPIRTFGLTAALGVCLIYLVAIHLLPPILTYFDRQPWPRRRSGLQFLDTLVSAMMRLGVRRPLLVIGVISVTVLVTAPLMLRIKAETNLLEFFPQQHPIRVDTNHIEEKLSGTLPLEIVFSSDDPERLLQPTTLRHMRKLQQALEQNPAVDKTLSVAEFIEEMNWGFNAEDPAKRTIPDDPNLISQYLLVYDGEDLFDFLDSNYRTTRLTISANVHGAQEIRTLINDTRQLVEADWVLNGEGIEWEISGAGRLFADLEGLLISSQIKSLSGALLLIFVLLLVSWRSLRDAALCMIPNLSPIVLIFIVMGLLRIDLDIATTMIASVAVGIAIDDTIHIYHGFIHRVRKGVAPAVALARTYRQAGRAVMTTTVILCSQFLILLTSSFVPMGYFGLLTSIGLLAALVFDLLLLPAILMLAFRPKAPSSTTVVETSSARQ